MRRFGYYWKEGLRNIFKHGFMSIAAIAIMVACLILTGTVTLIAYNIDLSIVDLQQSNEIVVWIDENLTTREAKDLQPQFEKISNIATVEFEDRDVALEKYREELGEDSSILEDYNSSNNPLRNSYILTLKDSTQAEETISDIEMIEGVANVRADEAVISKLIQIQHVFNIVALAMVVGLAVISIFIISNTVKLAMFARREEISIQKMVGATNWFIRWPFVIEGMIIGLVAGGLAFLAEWGLYTELYSVAGGVIPYFEILPFESLKWLVLAVFAGAGALFGIGGSVTSILHNIKAAKLAVSAVAKAKKLLKAARPDCVIGCGGYASFAVVKAAQELGIPTVLLEVNALPGKVTQMLAKKADRVLVCFEQAKKLLGGDEKIILTGAPVRGEILAASREKARAKFGLGENDQLVVSFWGSMGAKYMNEHMAGTLALECKNGVSYHHVHATGAAAREWLPKMAREQGADFENHPNIQYTEYIYDMADRMAAADLIVCRAGAATLGELCMLGRPALLSGVLRTVRIRSRARELRLLHPLLCIR